MDSYDLELDRIVKEIKKQKAKLVCLQLPDGLKPIATKIACEIERKTKATCLIWLGSCFGACDLPLQVKDLGVDLLIQFGHSHWIAKNN
jgi:2-(3-amino-3-carboxypropyl)histidine synthase